ncbi:MAG: toll/interleukin-1 receptor domain-containing protein [Acidobacteria bacterium]|nr:toll/interleukin-1 receptor domain-containing protein [Acidobacteriota bacterium]
MNAKIVGADAELSSDQVPCTGYEVRMNVPVCNERKLIFLSHGNPEDNVFTLWLGARLGSAGYEVWSDVTKLIGGEVFWDNIETAIRRHSAKFVSVISRTSVNKQGFKDELALAKQVERSQGLNDFVIPVRLGDIPYNDFPVEIIRRNAIDFSEGWHIGLAKLLRKLDGDHVLRRDEAPAEALSQWSKSLLQIDAALVSREEMLVSNWLPITGLPLSIRVSNWRGDSCAYRSGGGRWPSDVRNEQVFSFAAARDLDEASQSGSLTFDCEVSLDSFLRGESSRLSNINRQEARNIVSSLLRQAWESFAVSKGLVGFPFATGRLGFYMPLPDSGIQRIKFTRPLGKSSSRAILGHSEKRKVYWHYAPELIPVLGKDPRFTLVPHVVFTKDGFDLVGDPARMHRLRRSFCRNWWQDRWRDLSLSYLALLGGNATSVSLPVSPDRAVIISPSPKTFVSPVSVQDDGEKLQVDMDLADDGISVEEESEVTDDLDIDEEWTEPDSEDQEGATE